LQPICCKSQLCCSQYNANVYKQDEEPSKFAFKERPVMRLRRIGWITLEKAHSKTIFISSTSSQPGLRVSFPRNATVFSSASNCSNIVGLRDLQNHKILPQEPWNGKFSCCVQAADILKSCKLSLPPSSFGLKTIYRGSEPSNVE
jgi:hypothetical protein